MTDKMIEEMARDITYLTLDREVFVGANRKELRSWTLSEEDNEIIAKELAKKGYRKITDDLVVLNRDEYNRLIKPTLKSIEIAIAKFAEQEAKKKLVELAKAYGIDVEAYEW